MGGPGPGQEQRPVRYKPGKAGLDFFTSLVQRALPAWSVDSLDFSEAVIEFTLSRGFRRLGYALVRPGDDPRAMLFSNRVMGLRRPFGDEGVGPASDTEPRALFSIFGAVPFDLLLRRLKADGLFYTDPHGSRSPGRLDRFFRRTDHGLDWWKFFYPRQPALEEEVVLGSRVTVVSHCSP